MANSTIECLLDLVEGGQNHCSQPQPSIFVVPWIYRDQNPSCFDPQVVSIGPLHRDHKNVQKHEGLKGAYMHDLLARLDSFSSPQHTLTDCLSKVRSSIKKIKSCYGGMHNYHDLDVVKMMVIDACFIIEFVQKISEDNRLLILGSTFTAQSIKTDLLLIENQIPFFVLLDIFNLTLKKIKPNDYFITLLLDHVLHDYKMFKAEVIVNYYDNDGFNFNHILEILHETSRPWLPDLLGNDHLPNPISYSIEDLDRAGVKFKPNRPGSMLMTMENESFGWLWIFRFFGKPTFRMPVLTINDKTELLLRNLIAYEQSYPNVDGNYFTSFALAMNMLVDSTQDVAKLVESKVIANWLGSNENAVSMINSICTEVVCLRFMYYKEFENLDKYYKSYWRKNMARLRRRYFNSPWTVIALVSGILLFALTAIQTIFTVYP